MEFRTEKILIARKGIHHLCGLRNSNREGTSGNPCRNQVGIIGKALTKFLAGVLRFAAVATGMIREE
jgi:hypothetical protein